MKKFYRIVAVFMAVLMTLSMIPGVVMASLFENSPEYNKEILSALGNVLNSKDEAKKYYSVMEKYGLLSEDGSVVDNLHAEIDGKEYEKEELLGLLSGDYDGDKIAVVDGTPIKLDDLWNIIVIEGYINYLRDTYYLDGEWTEEHEKNYNSLIKQLTNDGAKVIVDENNSLVGDYSGINHGAVVSFKTSECKDNTVTVTASLSAAKEGQVVSFDYETISGSAKAEPSSGTVSFTADRDGKAEKTFTVKTVSEKINTLISDAPVAYINVKNLKNATFETSKRNATTIPFSGEPTVGEGKELDRIVGTFTKENIWSGKMNLTSGEKYAINHNIVNTLSETKHSAGYANFGGDKPVYGDHIDISYALHADGNTTPFYKNSIRVNFTGQCTAVMGIVMCFYFGMGAVKPADYVESVSLDKVTVNDDITCDYSCAPWVSGANYTFTDSTKPTVKSIYTPKANYTVGQTVPVVVEFSEPVSASSASVTVNGTVVKAQETKNGDRLTFPYTVKPLDSAHPVVTAVSAKDVAGNSLSSDYKPGSSGSLALTDAVMKSCLPEDSIEDISCEIDSTDSSAPVLNVTLTLSEESAMNEWLSSDLDEKGVSKSLFAAVKGFDKVPFKLIGDSFDGANMTASFTLTPTDKTKQFTTELYMGDELLIGSLRYVTQKAAALIKAEDIKTGMLVTEANGDPYVYNNPELPVIYVQDSPSIRAIFSLDENDYAYADTSLVTVLDSDGKPVSPDAHFAWSSSDTSVANIDADGKITPTGASGTVHFTLTAFNGSSEKAVSADTQDITLGVGLTPFLIIPNNEIKTTSGKDVPLFWSSNIPDKDENAEFSLTVKNGRGEAVYSAKTKACGATVPASVLMYDYNSGSDNTYSVVVSVIYNAETLKVEAKITLSSPPAVIKLSEPESLYLTDNSKSVDIAWTIDNFDCYSSGEDNLFRLYITKNDECVYESFNTPGTGVNGSYTGKYTLKLADVKTSKDEPTSYRDIYTVSIQAKNGSDSTWSYDSYVLYVYDKDALKLWVNGTEAGDTLTMTNIPSISAMSQEQILALKRDISLKEVISANYGDYAWTDLSDRISWNSSDSEISDLNYRQGSYYSSINDYSYTSYRPATEFVLAGLKTGTAQITATHALTGISDFINVKVDTLKDKLYLFSCTPAVETTMYYTDGKGKEKTAVSTANGEFAIYEEDGIKGDVYFSSNYDGFDYYGTYFENNIQSGESSPSSMNLYPCNNLVMRRAAYASVYLKNADGTPYVGDVIVRGGVYVNGEYVKTAKFGYKNEKLATHKGDEDFCTSTDSAGKLTVVMDSTQWELGDGGLSYSDVVTYDFVVKKAGTTEYYPLLVRVDASENEETFIRSGESIAAFRKNTESGEHPFVIATELTMKNDEVGYSLTQNILDSKDCIGVSSDITEEELSVSIMWWGTQAKSGDAYSMAVCTDDRYEISADKKTVTAEGIPFADVSVTTITVPFDTKEAEKCGIDAAPKGLELRYGDADCGISYSEELSFRIADTTNAPLTPDSVVEMVGGFNKSVGMANTSGSDQIDVDDNIIGLVMKLFSTKNYQPDKDHAAGFNMTVMPTADPTTFIAYLGLGLSNMSDQKVTGVYAKDSREKFGKQPGLNEVKWFFGGENASQNYVDKYKKSFENAKNKKTMKEIYYNVTGYIESRMKYNPDSGLWDIHVLSGGFDAGGGIGFVRYFNTMVGPVPVTAELRGGGTLNLSLDALTMEYLNSADEKTSGTEFLTKLRLFFYFKFFGGLGIDYSVVALKIGVFGQINADLTFEWLNRPSLPENATYTDRSKMVSTDKTLDGQNIKLNGRVGIEFVARLLFFSYERVIKSKDFPKELDKNFRDWNKIDEIWKASQEHFNKKIDPLLRSGAAKTVNVAGEEMISVDLLPTTESLDYLNGSVKRKWNSNTLRDALQSGAASDTNAVKMQTNANPFTSPVLSDDGDILVYLSDAAGDDTVHTAYAVRNETGYTDKGIISVNGSGDSGNTVAGTKDFAVAAWSSMSDAQAKDAGSVVTSEDQIIMMESSEVYASVYENGKWHTQALTENSTADIAPVVAVKGNKAIAVWRNVATTNLSGNIADFNANDVILYSVYENGSWSEAKSLYNGTSGNIKALNAAMLPDGTTSVIYSLDTDKTDSTSEDREIVWALIGADGEVSRTVRATNDETADENPQISATTIDGQPCFVAAWYSSYASGEELKYDIHMADFNSDGVILGRLPQSSEKMINEQGLLITSDFRFTKGSDSIDDLALVWVERAENEENKDGTKVEYDILNSVKFYAVDADNTRISLTAPQELAKAPDSTLIDSFDVVSNDNTSISVFLGTTYDSDKIQEKSGETEGGTTVSYIVPLSTSAIYTAKGTYTDAVSVKQVYADPDSLHCGANTSVAFTVMNDGVNPIESLVIKLAETESAVKDLNILPGDTFTVYVDYKVPMDTVCDEEYTVTAKTSKGTVSVSGTAELAQFEPEITSAQIVEENEGKRTIEIKLNNASDTKLYNSGKSVALRFYSDPACESEMTGLSEVLINDNELLNMIDNGGFSRQVCFDAQAYLKTLEENPSEIPEQGITVYIRAEIDGEENDGEVLSVSSASSVLCENLMTRTGNKVSVKTDFKTAEEHSSLTANIRNNRLSESESGNVIATLFDEDGNIVEQKQSYNPAEGESSLLSLDGEETKRVSFTFDKKGSYAEATYTELVLDDGTDATLSRLESTNIPGMSLSSFTPDAKKKNTFNAGINAYGVESISFIVSTSDPKASVTLNGEVVDGYITKTLADGKNTLDFAVTAQDRVTVMHYILTVNTKEDTPDSGVCEYCGKVHKNFFDTLRCLLVRFIFMILDLYLPKKLG